MTKPFFCGAFLLAVAKLSATEPGSMAFAPDQPRDLSSFAGLFAKSPFAMSTVSDQSPLSQRYVITGAMMIDDTPNVFLLDKTTQDRLMISTNHPDGGVTLVSLERDPDASKVRATIRAGSDTGVVAFEQAPAVPAGAPANPPANPASPDVTNAQPVPAAEAVNPAAPAVPPAAMDSGNLPAPPPRRNIIRRQAPIVPTAAQQTPATP